EVVDIVSAWLAARGLPVELVVADADVSNVVSDVTGVRPGRHVVFNAHMDTMPEGDTRLWTVPPFALTRRDGRVYGLGMGNMKGALAAMCVATAAINRRRDRLAGKLSLTAVSDEVMFGDRGTVLLLDRRPDLRGDFLISGEGPGYMGLAVAEKGLLWLDVEAHGESGHSSRAREGVTAPIMLARFLAEVDRLNGFRCEVPADLLEVDGGEGDVGLRLSINVGSLEAGGVRSQIAPTASAQLDVRLPPGIDVEEVEALICARIPPGATITVRRIKAWNANWTGIGTPLARALAEAAEIVRGTAAVPVVRLPGSDARRWRDLGVPALCYGPQPTLSAGIDDHTLERDLIDCARIYARTALRLMESQGSRNATPESVANDEV
ncbi:MAG TPA: M20/M25/M40 family metallo-hydrolase, partial [Sphingomonas sp.]|nr:M20/M25/M40 family metallo-hydrolase [Sphingomonas sp.]